MFHVQTVIAIKFLLVAVTQVQDYRRNVAHVDTAGDDYDGPTKSNKNLNGCVFHRVFLGFDHGLQSDLPCDLE